MSFLRSLLNLQGNSISAEQINLATQFISSLTDEVKYREYGPAFEAIRSATISYALAEVALELELEDEGLRHCLVGANYGLQGDNKSYHNGNAESIGHCISLLLVQFDAVTLANQLDSDYKARYMISRLMGDSDNNAFAVREAVLMRATAIGYVCLSRSILEDPENLSRARMSRFALLASHRSDRVKEKFALHTFGKNSILVQLIADLYWTAQEDAISNPMAYVMHRELAKKCRKELSNITFNGVRGSDMKLKELAAIGDLRHSRAFEKLSKQYEAGEFDLELPQLIEACVMS